jgi:tRNA(Ile2)-agmatinylcytidine synthase
MYVAFDDTDSIESMCTTFLATEVVDALRGFDLIGLPRLVRLNPAVPWKTRGNAAICLRFGRGKGQAMLAGMIRDTPIFCYPKMIEPASVEVISDRCTKLISKWSRVQEEASPGLVISREKPSARFYWRGVRDIIEKAEVVEELDRIGAIRNEWVGGRGIIGATAAMAWAPRDRTFEVIAYRGAERWGKPREISDRSVWEMDRDFPSTFNNYDETVDRRVISPHTPCPILFGIRGDDPFQLPSAMQRVQAESVDRWLLYLTNQGTDDHIVSDWSKLVPERSYAMVATVTADPMTVKGGHVVLETCLDRGNRALQMIAYEPSKSFRDVIRQLRTGDRIRAFGELRAEPPTLNLEKIEIISLAPEFKKLSNPLCPDCQKSMQSMGVLAGFRCRRCGKKAPQQAAEVVQIKRDIAPGWYEPPVSARRHLSKPLKRDSSMARIITL